jgi:hypothetical protein
MMFPFLAVALDDAAHHYFRGAIIAVGGKRDKLRSGSSVDRTA